MTLILPHDPPGETSTDDITDMRETPPVPDRHKVLTKEFIESRKNVNLISKHNPNIINRSQIVHRPSVPHRRRPDPKEKLQFTSQVINIMTSLISLLGKTQHLDFKE